MSSSSPEQLANVQQAIALLKKDASLKWARYIDNESSECELRVRVDALEQVLSVQGLYYSSADAIAAKIRGDSAKFLEVVRVPAPAPSRSYSSGSYNSKNKGDAAMC